MVRERAGLITVSLPASFACARHGREPAAQPDGDPQCRDATGHVHRQLQDIGPDHRLEPAEPGVDEGRNAHHDDRGGDAPAGDERQRHRAGKYPHAVAQEAGHQEDHRGDATRVGPEATLEPLVRGLLLAAEIAGQQPGGHADAADEVSEGELEEGEVAAGADPRHGDDRQRRGLGGHDGEHDRPGREVARPEEVVARRRLPPRHPEPEGEGEDEVDGDDGEIEGPH